VTYWPWHGTGAVENYAGCLLPFVVHFGDPDDKAGEVVVGVVDVRVALQDVRVAAPGADAVQRLPLADHVDLLARPRRQQPRPHRRHQQQHDAASAAAATMDDSHCPAIADQQRTGQMFDVLLLCCLCSALRAVVFGVAKLARAGYFYIERCKVTMTMEVSVKRD
jgi:hypothetical protein